MEDQKTCSSTEGQELTKILADFFKERLSYIEENQYPLVLRTDPPARFITHFVPEKFQELFLDIKKLVAKENLLVPMAEDPATILYDYNFDGILFFSSVHEKLSYTQVFRDGRFEMVTAITKSDPTSPVNIFSLLRLQKFLTMCLENHLSVFKKLEIPGPYYLYFHLRSMASIRLNPEELEMTDYDVKGRNKPLLRNTLFFPPYKVEHADINIRECLLPFFDILWNTFGFEGTPKISAENWNKLQSKLDTETRNRVIR